MIWQSHRIITGISVFLLSQNFSAALFAVSGSVFPDTLDLTLGLKHRKTSHWFVLYVIPLLAVGFFLSHGWFIPHSFDYLVFFRTFSLSDFILAILLNWIFWFLVGCLFHIVEDLCTGYIPLRSPSDSFSMGRLFYTGSPKENFCVLSFCLIGFIITAYRFVSGSFAF